MSEIEEVGRPKLERLCELLEDYRKAVWDESKKVGSEYDSAGLVEAEAIKEFFAFDQVTIADSESSMRSMERLMHQMMVSFRRSPDIREYEHRVRKAAISLESVLDRHFGGRRDGR